MLLLAVRLSHGPLSFSMVRLKRIDRELTGSNVGLWAVKSSALGHKSTVRQYSPVVISKDAELALTV